MTSILVTGATGRQGGSVARHLLSHGGHTVYCLVRTPTSPSAMDLSAHGATLIPGTFDSPTILQEACQRVKTIFLNVSPSFQHDGAEIRHASNVLAAATHPLSTVKTLIYTSVCDLDSRSTYPDWAHWEDSHPLKEYFTSKAHIETLFRQSRIENWMILRPPFFMTNFLSPSVEGYFPGLGSQGRLRTALPSGKRMMLLDPDDIGRVVARVVVEESGRFSKRVMDIGGEALTSGQIADAISRVTGKRVGAEEVGEDEAVGSGNCRLICRGGIGGGRIGLILGCWRGSWGWG
ncbi:NAD(P)-binding protein [Aspergillus sclerotioniger CBS 115572]|uniref:NAD(P)-binding protein n=1 Tax=Aspergillus sclerotioniger CBS 115572 TaxID=1450535 RepID=A0A317UTU5_9EURO|nr:NAD(P)-binding protein [Aspergillus sclerotioniger CBS 115572]PWY65005.1 NAD(P)-binding protein [Aspergillus sclerotioniger CBS 115572]